MKRTLATLLFALAFAFVTRPQQAWADMADEDPYRYGMPDLMVFIDGWNAETAAFLNSVNAKPELACSAAQRELVFRGQSMVNDLVGTGHWAPANLHSIHENAAQGLQRAVDGLTLAGQDCSGGALAQGQQRFQRGVFRYELYGAAIDRYLKGQTLGN